MGVAERRLTDTFASAPEQEEAMIELYNKQTNALIGSITEHGLQTLVDGLEEESADDRDYYITQATIGLLGDGKATDHLLELLRTALGSAEGVEIGWRRR